MSRLSSKLFFKGLHSPLYKPLRLYPSLRSPYHFSPYSVQVPCRVLSETYDTITRTHANYPTRINRIMRKKDKEARHQTKWIDIHDYDHFTPGKYDVIISDVDDRNLRCEISEVLGILYLDGRLYGYRNHPILPCVVRTDGGEARWVFFVLDTAAPATYISSQVLKVLNLGHDIPSSLYIAGYKNEVYLSPPDSHFAEINILGADFCNAHKVGIEFLGGRKIKVAFGRWNEIKESKL